MAHYLLHKQRKAALIFLSLQLILSLQRLIFDFLGYVWLIVIFGIIQLVFVIVGIFGAHQQKARYLMTYVGWAVTWIIINIVVIILYIGAGSFTHENDWLSFQQGNSSWYARNGIGCKVVQKPNSLEKSVQGCALDFKYVEIIQAGLQLLFSAIGCYLAIQLRKRVIAAKDVTVVGRINPYSSYVISNQSTRASKSSAITTEYPM